MIFVSTDQVWTSVPSNAVVNFTNYRIAGGRVAVGTDYPGEPPGMPLREFELLEAAGFSNMEIIQAATQNGAAAIGRSADLGTLEAGKIGDVIVVSGDPLADWHALANVETVILAGDVVRTPYTGPDDADGIDANIDAQECCHSGAFSDVKLGGTTWGNIVTRGGMTLTMTEEPNPAGVRVAAAGPPGVAMLRVCGAPIAPVFLSTGNEVVVTCHSASLNVIAGPVTAGFGSLLAEVPAGVELTVTNELAGLYDVESAPTSTSSALVGGVVVAPGATVTGIADTDEDGLADSVETDTGVYVSSGDTGTDPEIADDDGDGLLDGHEVFLDGTNPTDPDTDNDALMDGAEEANGTSPVLPDSDGDGFADLPANAHEGVNTNAARDNCPSVANTSQTNTGSAALDNGPSAPGNDITIASSDANGDACDTDDDNDGLADAVELVHPVAGCSFATASLNPLDMDTDGDHQTDGYECANGSDPANAASKVSASSSTDADGDRVFDIWEVRGYNASGSTADSDGDGCHDLVETASIDGNKSVADPDRLAVARRALGVWGPHAAQDYVLDIDKNGTVNDVDRLFVARAALLPAWQPKSCP
jgi:hypothetical protein